MIPMDKPISRFNLLYLGDSLLQAIEIRTGAASCVLKFHSGKVLPAADVSVFEASQVCTPAILSFSGVRSISLGNGPYQLNSTVVDFGAEPSSIPHLTEFFFVLTGGVDSDAYMSTLTVVAADFSFGSTLEPQESEPQPVPATDT